MKTTALDSVRQALPGMRATSQRALILDIIRQGRGHLDADEVHRLARKKQARISLSTVYRTLQTLKKAGLIDAVHFDEDHHHYEAKASAEHHHLVCVSCGRITEFEYPLADLVKAQVAAARDFEITGTETRITGYCLACRPPQE